jgi:uncharacterized damage-inducible protein DinB
MTTLIERQFDFNLWANLEIFGICASLDETQLAVEIPGAYGRIQPTIVHIVRAEGNYLRYLVGDWRWPSDMDWDALSIAQLSEMAQQTGAALREAVGSIDPNMRCESVDNTRRREFPAWLVINQAINHGIEHRAHLRMLLTKLGVPHPTLDVWEYAESIGELRKHDIS